MRVFSVHRAMIGVGPWTFPFACLALGYEAYGVSMNASAHAQAERASIAETSRLVRPEQRMEKIKIPRALVMALARSL